MKVSKPYSLLLLLLVVLVVYFPSINHTINTVDDVHIIKAYGVNGQRTLKQIVLPTSQFYYRPLLEITYFLDRVLWDLDPSFMHLENILFHTVNVMLVFLLASRLSILWPTLRGVPYLSALIFAVHPINTEAVSWIAGRTDPLAAIFILVSSIFAIKTCENGRTKDFTIAVLALFLSLLVKETSVMQIFSIALLVYACTQENDFPKNNIMKVGKLFACVCLIVFTIFLGYGLFRYAVRPPDSDNAFSMLLKNGPVAFSGVTDMTVVFGFYVTKLFWPFPLNFATDSISSWYMVPGILSIASALIAFRSITMPRVLLIISLLFITPAVVVYLVGINWTPVAERYLYIPAAFFSIWLSIAISKLISRKKHLLHVALPAMATMVGAFGFAAYKRNLTWSDNLSLYRDTVNKSPNFGDVHNELGVALVQNGDYTSARKHFILARQLSHRPMIRELARLNLLNIDMHDKPLPERREILLKYIASHEYIQPDLLKLLRNIDRQMLTEWLPLQRRTKLLMEIVRMNDRIFSYTGDVQCLYSNGQTMITLGRKKEALAYLHRAVTEAPQSAYYLEPARKLVRQLEQ